MVEPKDLKKLEKKTNDFKKEQRVIARQWLEFSKTEAGKDFFAYGDDCASMLIDYAKERVMPSPIGNGEQIIINGETASSLLQNARGCDIILSYARQYIDLATK